MYEAKGKKEADIIFVWRANESYVPWEAEQHFAPRLTPVLWK